jgi:drug/metabolite transporter (DMT)-like permease
MRRSHLDATAFSTLLVLCLSWGFNQVAAKIAMPTFPPLLQVGLRSAGAFVLVMSWCVASGRGELARRDQTLIWGLLAGLMFALEFALIFIGLQWTEASRAALFIYTAPFFVALGTLWLLPEERLQPIQWLGLALSFTGVSIALGVSPTTFTSRAIFGDALVLGGGALWGATTLLIKASPLRRAAPEKVLLYQLGVSAVAALAASYLVDEGHGPLTALPVASMIFQTVWVAGVTYVAWFWLVSNYPASPLQSATSMTPLFGIVGAFLVLGEPIRLSFVLAALLVVGGLLLVNKRKVTPVAERSEV